MHQSKSKLMVVVLIAVCAFSSVAASSAFAGEGTWLVKGTKLLKATETLALSTTAQIDESTFFNVPSLKTKVTCSGGTAKVLTGLKPYIQGPNTGGAESLIFEGCSEIEPSGCHLEVGHEKVETNPVVVTLETGPQAPEDRIHFAPKAGKVFANIVFEKSSCALSGEQPVDGSVVVGAPTGQTELTMQPIAPLGTTENNNLEIAGDKAYLEKGRALLLLASGLPWSFHS
jgi:hypothetical protein